MASSGRIEYVITDNGWLELEWTQKSQSTTNNTTTISWMLTFKGPYAINDTTTKYWEVVIDGKTYEGSNTLTKSAGTISTAFEKILASGTTVISHNANGSKTFNYSFSQDIGLTYDGVYTRTATASGSATLNKITIPNPSITSAPNFTDEGNPTIKYTNPYGNNVAALNVGIANSSGTMIVPYREVSAVSTSYTFNLTDAERTALRNAAKSSSSITVKFYIEAVYNGKSYYGNASRTMTIVNANPVITGSVVDVNPDVATLTGSTGKFVRYYSNAQVSASAEAKKGATIDLDTLIIRNGSRTSYSNPATFNAIESGEFILSVADSRGISGSTTITVPIVEYVILTCNLERAELDTAGVLTIDCSGNYFNQSFGAVNNTLTVQCRYKPQDGSYSSWMNMSVSKYENTYTASMDISGLNYREKYVIQCRAIDKLNEASTPETVVKSLPVFHWSENDFVFEVPVVFNAGASGADIAPGEGGTTGGSSSSGIIDGNATIGGDCVINGDLRLKGSGNYGNTLYFGDGSYAMISEPSDDTLTIKATTLNLNGNTVNLNGYPIGYGTWIPTLNNSSAVSSYGVRQGWYSRMGNVITIGWQLKATINSGYSSTSLSISGAPFIPAYAAFGGGVAHNINVSAGFNFEGWTIDTSGSISARMQPCNGTSAGNLQISSTAYYPSGSGNTLTLAGTICYVIN